MLCQEKFVFAKNIIPDLKIWAESGCFQPRFLFVNRSNIVPDHLTYSILYGFQQISTMRIFRL